MTSHPLPPESARIEALEIRIAYQDEVIEDLNKVVVAQWRAIEALQHELHRQKDAILALSESASNPRQPEFL